MCGIAGIADIRGPIDQNTVRRMTKSIAHRGPDGEGLWSRNGACLGAVRLAVIDLHGGKQPMTSDDGRWAVVYNGEVYNHLELRKELEDKDHKFHTRCDTEVVLHAVMEWGMNAPDKLRGIFAYAVWDSFEKKLLLARDRLGVKPLYKYEGAGFIAFASEIKALLQVDEIRGKIEPEHHSIHTILLHNFPVGDRTPFKGITEVPAGMAISWRNNRLWSRRYWDMDFPKLGERGDAKSEEIIAEELLEKLREAVRIRLMSDVPIGVFVSGGTDSGIVAALTAAEMKRGPTTFCIGFDEALWDESKYAQIVAEHIGADHNLVQSKVGLDMLPEVIYYLDQPQRWAGTASLLQLYRAAKEKVTVVLTGEGADEILIGYPHIAKFYDIYSKFLESPNSGDPFKYVDYFYSKTLSNQVKFHEEFLLSDEFLASMKIDMGGLMRDRAKIINRDALDVATYLEIKNRLPRFVLFMQDRLSMAAGIEARVPFLDHKLVEFTATIPPDLKFKPPIGKYILRKSARGLLPDEIIDRPKHGFVEPADAWMRSKLPECIAYALSDTTCSKKGFFRPESVKQLLGEHRSGNSNNGHLLIGIASVHLWHDIFFSGAAPQKPAY